MTQALEVSAVWSVAPKDGERDIAELRLKADGDSLTQVIDLERAEKRDFVRSSAVSLALWFADNWWRLRHESLPNSYMPTADWRLRHELTSAAGGTLWPPVMIHSTGDRVLVTPTYGRQIEQGALQYLLPTVKSLSGAGYEAGLDAFFAEVLGVCARALDAPALKSVVDALAVERVDPEVAGWRMLEARLGYDPDGVPDALMKAYAKLEVTVGEEAANEAAAAEPGSRSAAVLAKAVAASKASEVIAELEIADGLPRDRINAQAAPPWRLAKDAAYQIRQAAGLGDGPIQPAKFAELLGARQEDLRKQGTARGLPYSARIEARSGKHRLALGSADMKNRRFELACFLGERVWAQSSFGVVSSAKTDRQKFQRAFAQNLLVPFEDLREHISLSGPTAEEVEQAAKTFKVHRHVIKRLLILENVFPEETFDERLEAA